jgi:pyruvate dehydrogenase E1 component alpha subunit
MFDHVFAEQTPDLEAQYESFAALREEFGDDAFLNE